VPVVGKHTCLKAFASAQLGEISGHNNSAQENVSDFISAGGSPCEPVLVRTAVRNPVDERRLVHVGLTGVPKGWMAQLPNAWVWLDGNAEKEIDVAIWPVSDLSAYEIGSPRKEGKREFVGTAPVRVLGGIGRSYDVSVMPSGDAAASRVYPIGGVFYRVHVRRRSAVKIEVGRDDEAKRGLAVFGSVFPQVGGQQVVVDVTAPTGEDAATAVTLTVPDGSFRARVDLTKALATFGRGTYTVQASIFDADELDDATSNQVQLVL
jgi:hypothetical protein